MPEAALIAACTSCAAPSIERVRLNCSVIWLVPSLLVLSIEASPVIWPNCRSRLAVTSVAVTSGLAPGSWVEISMVGKSTCGSAETGSAP